MRPRRNADHLKACPGARRAFEYADQEDAQMLARASDPRWAHLWTPNYKGSGDVKWMHPEIDVAIKVQIMTAESSSTLVKALGSADVRLLIADAAQRAALPVITPADAWEIVRDGERAPFPVTWIETPDQKILYPGGAVVADSESRDALDEGRLLGTLVLDNSDFLAIVPMFHIGGEYVPGTKVVIPRMADAEIVKTNELDGATVLLLKPILGDGSGFEIEATNLYREVHQGGPFMNTGYENDPIYNPFLASLTLTEGVLPIVGSLLMLLSSTNVSLSRDPAKLPRDARRAAAKGAIAPDVIDIRVGKRGGAKGDGNGGKLETRHEVRGHFKHWPQGTRMFDQADPVKHRKTPERGWHVRYWSPPHVRGPIDAPLVIKPRRVRS